jgi:hypothetical protein
MMQEPLQMEERRIQVGGSAPEPPGFTAFIRQNGMFSDGQFEGGLVGRPMPFRPLRRSLGLLPSMALSRPTQVGLV